MNDKMKYQVNRKVWQVLWDAIMTPCGFGYSCDDFSNDTFEYRLYHWDDIENDYHFYHKPSGFKIEWYKYPLRGARCNMKITDGEFIDILNDCINSIEKESNKMVKVIYDVDEWWLP